MKKNPLLVVAGILLVYGLILAISNLGVGANALVLGQVMLIHSDKAGGQFLYFLILGVISGFLLAKGVQNRKKRSDRPEF